MQQLSSGGLIPNETQCMFEAKAVFLLERLRNADLSTCGGVIAESKQFFRISHHSLVKNSADAVFSAIFPSVLTPPFDVFLHLKICPVTGHKLLLLWHRRTGSNWPAA